MRLFSHTSLWLLFAVLCTTCLAEPVAELDSNNALKLLDRRQRDRENRPSTVLDAPAAAKTTDEDEDEDREDRQDRTRSATNTATASSKPAKSSAAPKTSATAKPTSAATTKQTDDKPTTSKSSTSKSTKEKTPTNTESSPTTSASTTSNSTSSSSTSTDVPQQTSILAQQPQSKEVSVGGIAAGVVLGAAVVIGIVWIAVAKWRETKRRRAQLRDTEGKSGFAGAGAGGDYTSSQDSLLAGAGAKPSGRSNGLRMQALSPLSRAHSFVSSRAERPWSQIPQDVLPPPSPAQDKSLPQLPQAQPQFTTPLGSHPNIAEMPSPDSPLPPAGLQAGRSVPRRPVPRSNTFSPGGGQREMPAGPQSTAVELPG